MTRILLTVILTAAAACAQTYAQHVREMERPERVAVSGQCTVSLVQTTAATCTAYTAPAGKRLVIEQASLSCELTALSTAGLASAIMKTQLEGQEVVETPLMFETFFFLSEQVKRYTAEDPVRLYADAGTAVTVSFERSAGNGAATASCTARVHGWLFPL